MATQGPNGVGTAADDAGVGTVTWSNPSQATSDDATAATASLGPSAVSHWIKCTNCGFSVPAGSTIDGITVEFKRSSDSGGVTTDGGGVPKAFLVKAGTVSGTGVDDLPGGWPSTSAYKTLGGSSSLWGTTWTVDQINDSGFGFAVSGRNTSGKSSDTARLFYVLITIHYTEGAPAAGHPAVKRMGGVKFAHGGYRDGSGMMMWRHSQSGIWLPNNRTIIQPENRIAV